MDLEAAFLKKHVSRKPAISASHGSKEKHLLEYGVPGEGLHLLIAFHIGKVRKQLISGGINRYWSNRQSSSLS